MLVVHTHAHTHTRTHTPRSTHGMHGAHKHIIIQMRGGYTHILTRRQTDAHTRMYVTIGRIPQHAKHARVPYELFFEVHCVISVCTRVSTLLSYVCTAGMHEGVLRLFLWCVSSGIVTLGDRSPQPQPCTFSLSLSPSLPPSLPPPLSLCRWVFPGHMVLECSCTRATKGKFTLDNLIVVGQKKIFS